MNAIVKFISYEWDNYQGASGKVVEIERVINLPDDMKISNVRDFVTGEISNMGFVNDWGRRIYNDQGIISIKI